MAGRPTVDFESQCRQASEQLRRCQPPIRELVQRVGPCTLRPNPDHFLVLARTIISQQLSTQAATTIAARMDSLFGKKKWEPAKLLKANAEKLRLCGLSSAKAKSLRDLAQKAIDGDLPLRKLARMDDDEVRSLLLEIHGIGPWSVDMFLIFSLGRLDILPVGDLGLRAGIRDLFALAEMPGAVDMEELAESWRPYRSIATWYIWRSRGDVPQSDSAGKAQTAAARRKRS